MPVTLLPIAQIQIPPNRQRKKVDGAALSELAASIQGLGLFHPVVLQGDRLVAGYRRLRAVTLLAGAGRPIRFGGAEVPLGQIPTVQLGDLPPEKVFEAELEENIRRVDLTLQERAAAVAELAALRRQQGRKTEEIAKEIFPSLEVESAINSVRKMALIHEYREHPKVAKAKNEREALNIIKAEKAAEQFRAIASRSTKAASLDDVTLLHGDCLEVLPRFQGVFDCIIADPPYGVGAHEFSDFGGALYRTADQWYSDTPEAARQLLEAALPLITAAAKPDAHLYLWCDIDQFVWLRELVRGHGWSPYRVPIVWVKPGTGRVPVPGYSPARKYEIALFAWRGQKQSLSIFPDAFTVEASDLAAKWGMLKSPNAYYELLRRSCGPEESVLDCFAGRGPLIPAAKRLHLKATLIEIDTTCYGACSKLLEELCSQPVQLMQGF